jgi:hypothetical protein
VCPKASRSSKTRHRSSTTSLRSSAGCTPSTRRWAGPTTASR